MVKHLTQHLPRTNNTTLIINEGKITKGNTPLQEHNTYWVHHTGKGGTNEKQDHIQPAPNGKDEISQDGHTMESIIEAYQNMTPETAHWPNSASSNGKRTLTNSQNHQPILTLMGSLVQQHTAHKWNKRKFLE